MSDEKFEEFRDTLYPFVVENGGRVHRDEAFLQLKEETSLSPARINGELDRIVKESGDVVLKSEEHQTSAFDGNIAGLRMQPGNLTGETYHGLGKLEDIGHPLVPDQEEYFDRTLEETSTTDVEVLCRAMADGDFNPLLSGEAGTGKDTLILHACAKTNRPVVRVNFGSDIRYEDLVGMYVLDSDQQMRWRDGQLTAAVRHGWTFIADELNAAPPESTMPLHQVTEESDKASLVIRERGEVVEPHPHFRFVATMNPPDTYGGTNRLNDAFKSRFYTIEVDYLDADREAELLKDKLDVDSLSISGDDVDTLCEMASKLRMQYKRGDIVTPVTTRELLKACKMSETMPLNEAAWMVLTGHAAETDRELIQDVVQTFF